MTEIVAAHLERVAQLEHLSTLDVPDHNGHMVQWVRKKEVRLIVSAALAEAKLQEAKWWHAREADDSPHDCTVVAERSAHLHIACDAACKRIAALKSIAGREK